MRVLRAAIALWAIFEFVKTSDWMMLAMGGFFAVQAIFNLGCCGASGCATSPNLAKRDLSTQEIDYEEIK